MLLLFNLGVNMIHACFETYNLSGIYYCMLGLFYNYVTHLIFMRYINRLQQILFLKFSSGRMFNLVWKKTFTF